MTVFFNGSKSEDPDGTIENYEWDFGDGTPSLTGVAVEHNYSEPGQYTVTLTVRDNRWSYDSDTCKVKLSDPPAPVSNQFVERVHKREHVVDAMDDANTTVTLNTTDQVTVMVLRYEDNPYPGDPIPAMALPNYVDVEVSDPDAVVWPIYVEMFYTDEEVEGLDEYSLGIYYWFNGTWQRCSDTGVDTVRNVVWAYMTVEEAAGSPILMGGMPAMPVPPLPPFLDNLVITPEVVELGGYVTISFDIRNMDSQPIEYGVDIYIENVNVTRIWVQLGAYESLKVLHALLMDTVGEFNVTVAGLTGSFEVKAPPEPAEFKVTDLEITPEEVEEGEAVTVSVDVTNVGEKEGSYTVELVLDGIVVGSEEITPLGGGMTATVVFELTRGEGTYQVEVDGLTGSFTVKAPPEPAEFEVKDLEITPEEVEEGEEVTITLKVSNIGDEEGTHTVELRIDGSLEESKTVTLPGGGTEEISFEVTRDEGTYQIEADGLTGEFTVTAPPGPPLIPGYFSGIVILIVVAAVVIIYLYLERSGPFRLPSEGAAQS
jgi:PKD repeat protein